MAPDYRTSYTAKMKLRAVELAQGKEDQGIPGLGNNKAGQILGISERCIRRWRGAQEVLSMMPSGKCAQRSGTIKYPELEKKLKTWVLKERSNGQNISLAFIGEMAKHLAEKEKLENFRGGPSWCSNFLRRAKLRISELKNVKQELSSTAGKFQEFQEAVIDIGPGSSENKSILGTPLTLDTSLQCTYDPALSEHKIASDTQASYTSRTKLKAVELVHEYKNQVIPCLDYNKADHIREISESCIRRWKNAQKTLPMTPREKCAQQSDPTKLTHLESELQIWALKERFKGHSINLTMIDEMAKQLAAKDNLKDFQGGPSWCNNFLQRANIKMSVPPSVKQALPKKTVKFQKSIDANVGKKCLDHSTSYTIHGAPLVFDAPVQYEIDPVLTELEIASDARASYTAETKLKAIELAQGNKEKGIPGLGNNKAGQILGISESCIRRWRCAQEKLSMMPSGKRRSGFIKFPELERKLKILVLKKRSEDHSISLAMISEMAKQLAEKDKVKNFRGGSSWCSNFLQRAKLKISALRGTKQTLQKRPGKPQQSTDTTVQERYLGQSTIPTIHCTPQAFDRPVQYSSNPVSTELEIASDARASYTAETKLKAIELAQGNKEKGIPGLGNNKAGHILGISESCIRRWRCAQEKLSMMPRGKRRSGSIKFPEVERKLKIWVLKKRSKGHSISLAMIGEMAKQLAEKDKLKNFRGGPRWCNNFMKRAKLKMSALQNVKQALARRAGKFQQSVDATVDGTGQSQSTIHTIHDTLETFDTSVKYTSDPVSTKLEIASDARASYTAETKLKAIELAQGNKEKGIPGLGNNKAGQILGISESCIRRWRCAQEKLSMMPSGKRAQRSGSIKFPELEQKLKIWVLDQRSNGNGPSVAKIIEMARQLSLEDNLEDFRGGPSWCHNFMRRAQLRIQAVPSVQQELLENGKDNADKFRHLKAAAAKEKGIDVSNNHNMHASSCTSKIGLDFRASYTVETKLKAVRLAQGDKEQGISGLGNVKAGEVLGISESCIRRWREAQDALKMMPMGMRAQRTGPIKFPELERKLQIWVLGQISKGHALSLLIIGEKAKNLAEEDNLKDFRGGPSWCSNFMRRAQLTLKMTRGNSDFRQLVPGRVNKQQTKQNQPIHIFSQRKSHRLCSKAKM